MKLYEVPHNTLVRVLSDISVPPAAPPIEPGDIIRFYYIDGMYSFCHNKRGDIVHLAAWAEVEEVLTDEGIDYDDLADQIDEAERDCN